MDFGFPAMLALIFLQIGQDLVKQGLAVCLVHELGHGIAMCLTGAGLQEIRLYAAGIQMRTNTCLLRTGQALCISLSGPLINLLCAFLLRHVQPLTAVLHLSMGIFNLLPYQILDGGTALQCLFENYQRIIRILHGFCILLSGAAAFVLYSYHIQNPMLYIMLIYLAVSEIPVDKFPSLW